MHASALIHRTFAAIGIVALAATVAVAHPPWPQEYLHLVERFSDGFDHPELVRNVVDVQSTGGELVFGAWGSIEWVDPNESGFATVSTSSVGFSDLLILVHDAADGDWEISLDGQAIGGSTVEVPARLSLRAVGSALMVEYTSDRGDGIDTLERRPGWLVFRFGSDFDPPAIERDGEEEILSSVWGYKIFPEHITMSGSHFQVDEFIITPWTYTVATEAKSWGAAKACY